MLPRFGREKFCGRSLVHASQVSSLDRSILCEFSNLERRIIPYPSNIYRGSSSCCRWAYWK